MPQAIKICEIECKAAIGRCGFPGGGLAINPYVGCEHACVYCYARFIKRFTGHTEEWGTFVDCRTNIAEVLAKQMQSPKFGGQRIYLSTVTDPYQPIEEKYGLTRKILEVLVNYDNPLSVLTKSDLILRDLDLLKKFKEVDVNFTITTLDETWKGYTEPGSKSVGARLEAARKLVGEGIPVLAMVGPYWPVFTDPTKLFKRFNEVGISQVFLESFNAIGGNFTGVEEVLKKHYPELYSKMKELIFDKIQFDQFYKGERLKIMDLSRQYQIPTTVYFATGHAANKFDPN